MRLVSNIICIGLLLLLTIGATLSALIFGWFALADYNQLQIAQSRFQQISGAGKDFATIFSAYAKQDIHRTNLFADGVWSLLSGIIASIGIHGICVSRISRIENAQR